MNKFKKGDVVVHIEFEDLWPDLYEVIRVFDQDMLQTVFVTNHRNFEIGFRVEHLRHARPEEIKANKRSCTHSMTEITVFGDLKRIYECEKCGHKEYEEWVSHD